MSEKKILIIQTAFIGDAILATSLVEYLHKLFPKARIDFLLRKGNESILETSPHVNTIYIWDKNGAKYKSLFQNISKIRKENYWAVLNIQRFANSGLVTALSKAKIKVGFDKNPLSFLFDHKIKHLIPHKHGEGHYHEVQRNAQLVSPLLDIEVPNAIEIAPKIYFTQNDEEVVKELEIKSPYLVMAPSSVWFTKQWHISKWQELIDSLSNEYTIYLLGAPSDYEYLEQLKGNHLINLAGKLSLRQSALLMKEAKRVFVNDSAPLHLASSVNANTTAIFCSTVPSFGYTPIGNKAVVVEEETILSCRPCGLHGHKDCPKSHFNCSQNISIAKLISTIS